MVDRLAQLMPQWYRIEHCDRGVYLHVLAKHALKDLQAAIAAELATCL